MQWKVLIHAVNTYSIYFFFQNIFSAHYICFARGLASLPPSAPREINFKSIDWFGDRTSWRPTRLVILDPTKFYILFVNAFVSNVNLLWQETDGGHMRFISCRVKLRKWLIDIFTFKRFSPIELLPITLFLEINAPVN